MKHEHPFTDIPKQCDDSVTNRSDAERNSFDTDDGIEEQTSMSEFCYRRRRILLVATLSISLLVIGLIVMVAVLATSLKLNQSNPSATGIDSAAGATAGTSATAILLSYDVGGGGASGGPPCSSYTVVNDPTRHVSAYGSAAPCDNGPFWNTTIGGRWVRFIGSGGTVMPNTSPGSNVCGGYLAGYFNSSLPTTLNVTINGAVCFTTMFNSCGFWCPASVMNCGSFYVYFLPPTEVCNARYCTV